LREYGFISDEIFGKIYRNMEIAVEDYYATSLLNPYAFFSPMHLSIDRFFIVSSGIFHITRSGSSGSGQHCHHLGHGSLGLRRWRQGCERSL
jgi:hypothetical protein